MTLHLLPVRDEVVRLEHMSEVMKAREEVLRLARDFIRQEGTGRTIYADLAEFCHAVRRMVETEKST